METVGPKEDGVRVVRLCCCRCRGIVGVAVGWDCWCWDTVAGNPFPSRAEQGSRDLELDLVPRPSLSLSPSHSLHSIVCPSPSGFRTPLPHVSDFALRSSRNLPLLLLPLSPGHHQNLSKGRRVGLKVTSICRVPRAVRASGPKLALLIKMVI